jgi:RNA polymerase sigma-70 factor (ECF subfamily)
LQALRFCIVLTGNEGLARALLKKGEAQGGLKSNALASSYTALLAIWQDRLNRDPSIPSVHVPEARLFKASQDREAQHAKFYAYMPWQDRTALYLVYGEGLSYDVAAEICGVSVQSFMQRLASGHQALSAWLDQSDAAAYDYERAAA